MAGKQHYTFTLALSPSILAWEQTRHLSDKECVHHLIAVKQSENEHPLLVTTHTHIALNSILEGLPQIDAPPCLLGYTITSPNGHPAQWHTSDTTYINELSPT